MIGAVKEIETGVETETETSETETETFEKGIMIA